MLLFACSFVGADFTNVSITITIPASEDSALTTFVIPEMFDVIDDDINEIDQRLALVGQLGDDVPDRFACFQEQIGDTECFGRTGATEIRIADNDGKYCQ